MSGERRARLLALLTTGGPGLEHRELCAVATEAIRVTGAGIMVMSGDSPAGSVCTSDGTAAILEDLQFTLGEGPCIDAFLHQRPVLEPNLLGALEPRWPAFTGLAIDAGVRAVFGFPLRTGEARLGALNLYCDAPGNLTVDQHADALVLADLLTRAVLLIQSEAPAGELAAALQEGSDFHYVVHQAAGMVAAQLEVNVGQALVRLRAHAFSSERPLLDVADDVVGRRLRFDDKTDPTRREQR